VQLTIRGKKFRLVRYRRMPRGFSDCNGFCSPPRADDKPSVIGIWSSLGGRKELEIVVHELLHAAHWDLAEEAVDETARDLAAALWRMGYRRPPAG